MKKRLFHPYQILHTRHVTLPTTCTLLIGFVAHKLRGVTPNTTFNKYKRTLFVVIDHVDTAPLLTNREREQYN